MSHEPTAKRSAALPAYIIQYTDSAFTNPHEVVLPDDPKECTGDFTHMGAKYWGLETRRHKALSVVEGEDALAFDYEARNELTIGLGSTKQPERFDVDHISISTKWFTGNQVPCVSVYLIDEISGSETGVLDRVDLAPDSEHEFNIAPTSATECRVELFYEGGIARINFFGEKSAEQLPERRRVPGMAERPAPPVRLEGAEQQRVHRLEDLQLHRVDGLSLHLPPVPGRPGAVHRRQRRQSDQTGAATPAIISDNISR